MGARISTDNLRTGPQTSKSKHRSTYPGNRALCHAAIGEPVHVLERLVENNEDPADSRINDMN